MLDGIEYRLEELCLKITDGSHHSPKSVDDGYPMASVKDMYEYGLNIEGCRKILKNDYEKLVRNDCKPLKNDILITKDGATYLRYIFVWRKEIDIVLLSSIAILRPNIDLIDPYFLKYYLTNPSVKSALKNYVSGAAIPRIVLKDFKTFKVRVPDIEAQQKIASVLSAYDDLIENNTRRIKILEEVAQTIYKEWFVNLRFPGHEKVNFIDSPLGKMPEEWEIKPYDEIAEFINGFAFKPTHWGKEGKPIIKIAELKNGITNKTPFNSGDEIPKKYHIKNGDILFSWSADLDVYYWSGGEALLNQHLFNVKPFNSKKKIFVYYSLKNNIQEFRNRSLGTTMKHIKRSALGEVSSVCPGLIQVKKFNKITEPILLEVLNLRNKNQNLCKTRDLLLPKLMSGEVEV